MENLYERYRPILIPVSILVVSLVLIFVLTSSYLGRLSNVNKNISKEREQISVLEGRLGKLREASADIPAYSQNTLLALPVDNSALVVVAQIRRFVQSRDLTIEDLSIEGFHEGEEGELSRVDLSFVVKGTYTQASGFLADIGRLLPLINISSVDMSTNAEVVSAQIVLSSFWSPLPEKLPSITEAISSLSDEELAVLNTLSTFTTPLGGAAGELIAAPARENPFSF